MALRFVGAREINRSKIAGRQKAGHK
jgi:hypothetical protein